jgi:hypothetical protein
MVGCRRWPTSVQRVANEPVTSLPESLYPVDFLGADGGRGKRPGVQQLGYVVDLFAGGVVYSLAVFESGFTESGWSGGFATRCGGFVGRMVFPCLATK